MNGRERIKCILNHKEADKVPIHDAPWKSTLERWYKEGFPKGMSVNDYFGYDMNLVLPNFSPQLPFEIIEENDKYIIEKNEFGTTIKNYKDHSTTPQFLDFPVKNKEDWGKLKERLVINSSRLVIYNDWEEMFYPHSRGITTWDKILELYKREYSKGGYFIFSGWVGYDMAQHYLGAERVLIAMLDDPKWVKDIFETSAKLLIDLHCFLEDNGIICDGAFIGHDMGYGKSSLFSPNCYKELLLDSDRLICDYFHSREMKVIVHSDGNIRDLIPYLIKAGFDCLQPLEVKAGMDVRELKKEYGDKLSFMGGIDVRLMADNDPSKIEEEIRNKFEIAKKGGGYIYHSDHSVPNNVSLSQYKNVINLVNKYGKY